MSAPRMRTFKPDILCSQSTGPSPHKTTSLNSSKKKWTGSPFVEKCNPRRSLLLVLKHVLGILYLLTRLNPFSVSKYNAFKLTNQVALPPHPQDNLTKVFQNANWLWGSLSLAKWMKHKVSHGLFSPSLAESFVWYVVIMTECLLGSRLPANNLTPSILLTMFWVGKFPNIQWRQWNMGLKCAYGPKAVGSWAELEPRAGSSRVRHWANAVFILCFWWQRSPKDQSLLNSGCPKKPYFEWVKMLGWEVRKKWIGEVGGDKT